MRDGRIEQLGTPEEIYTAPANEYVARFVGTSNRLEVTVLDTPDRVEWHGQPVPVVADRSLPAGSAAAMIVRPERIRVSAPGEGAGGWDGTVVERTFLGSVTRLTLRVGDDGSWPTCPARRPLRSGSGSTTGSSSRSSRAAAG